MTQSELQADAVAKIALELPDHVTSRDMLMALAAAHSQGWRDCLEHTQALAQRMLGNRL